MGYLMMCALSAWAGRSGRCVLPFLSPRGTLSTWCRVVLDMDSSESPVHGAQEGSAYNGHFESVCYHPLFLFTEHGDCLGATLRPGNVHSADDWDNLLLPEIDRQQAEGKRVAFRADAAFAKPEIYAAGAILISVFTTALGKRRKPSPSTTPLRWPPGPKTTTSASRCSTSIVAWCGSTGPIFSCGYGPALC